ncbi:response regulator [Actinokineospora globicatena]|uniref:Response regulatory domain-containing protein n=1 Tax=Actinokineospora globicatena TaxID=103729 RepID=A0A9W6QJA3_9PSEU|nr:response regulator [Actinokineospora globicatena]MCP2304158.1 Response regulator receiver domain [Actinokineospora globicatena]GLW78485.1 hypothetical protein Aglo01_29670 [Actinokineospora globicatena]GLW84851.1 hypothetical protein Aglo02_24910 [Actinokineospora globicatena]GLW91091.1 hypothetical protein Aglo03_19070 [Actinokineospora globicatena]
MRIVVVDDILEVGNTVARALDGSGHEVRVLLSPAAVGTALAGHRFDLAFVDLDFSYESSETGLTALRHLAAADVPAVVYSADSEENRALLLLAAFQHYAPLALLSKSATQDQIRALVKQLVGSGMRPATDPLSQRYRPQGTPTVLDQLVRNQTELTIWRLLSQYADRNEVAIAAHVHSRTVDKFLATHYPVMREVEARLRSLPREPETPKKHLLAPMHAFAVKHARFFADTELEALVRDRQPPARRTTAASRAARKYRDRP